MTAARTRFEVNGRSYVAPGRAVVVICIDGCEEDYLDAAIERGLMPTVEVIAREGLRTRARAALPSFTNVNNAAIATGCPPSQTGISGNFLLDPDTGEEVMMNSAAWLRIPTILSAAEKAGRRVAMVTAKEKLRDILSKDLDLAGGRAIAFSSERAASAVRSTHGIDDVERLLGRDQPEIYSAHASLYVLDAGIALIERGLTDFCYLSLTDWVQHAYAPDAPEAIAFMAGIDRRLSRLLQLNCVVAATADHGMNDKASSDGSPTVVYLESELERRFGPGIRVICPITDPYVAHHGALGSAVTVHLDDTLDHSEVAAFIESIEGVTEVYDRARAAEKLELPADRIGELYVLSGRNVVLGRRPEYHDLSGLQGRLRSHGGRFEEMVPMLLSQPPGPVGRELVQGELRNFDVFSLACDDVAEEDT